VHRNTDSFAHHQFKRLRQRDLDKLRHRAKLDVPVSRWIVYAKLPLPTRKLASDERQQWLLLLDSNGNVPLDTRGFPTLRMSGVVGAAGLVALMVGCTATPAPVATPVTRTDLRAEAVRCIEELGFEAEVDNFGGISSPEMSPELGEQWQVAADQCREETGWDVEDYNDDQLAELYALEVAQYECLVNLGYSPEEPPSIQQYIDSWSSRTDPPYQPFGTVIAGLPPAEMESVLQACPPPRWSFLG
jgi:hypothetical protein